MKLALLVTAILGATTSLSFRGSVAATPAMWLWLFVPYVLIAAFALYRAYDDGTLLDVMRLRAGDFTLGFLIAALIFGGAWCVRHFLFAEASPRLVWVIRIALSTAGAPRSPLGLFAVIASIGALEEIVWRGLVLSAVTESLGTRRAWPVAAGLYALAHIPTVFTLADPIVGPNPLLFVAALGAGMVWSFAASLFGRLPPVIVSHAVFSYFAITMLLPRVG
jgi:membrane protease YdiL (CAAX protease family)